MALTRKGTMKEQQAYQDYLKERGIDKGTLSFYQWKHNKKRTTRTKDTEGSLRRGGLTEEEIGKMRS